MFRPRPWQESNFETLMGIEAAKKLPDHAWRLSGMHVDCA